MALASQQSSSTLVRRVAIVVCLVVALVCVTLYAREDDDGVLHGIQNTVTDVISPLTFAGSEVDSATSSVEMGIEDITADEETLSGLREYNAELLEENAALEEYRQEAERLEGLLEMRDMYGLDGVGARVIGRSTTAWDQTITIDKGTSDGLKSGLTVMGSAGVIGQIVSVGETTAKIRLLTDPQSGAAAMLQSSRAEGVVRGSLEGLLYLEDLDISATVEEGDVVITSGLGGSYKSGLVIGTVVRVDSQQGEASRRVVVSQNNSTTALEEVLVILDDTPVSTSDEEDES